MNYRYDVAVIGAGIVGVSTALHLLMRGKKVLLIDRQHAGLETSYGNAGIIQNFDTLPVGFPPLARIPQILRNQDTAARVRYRDLPRMLPWIIEFYWQSLPKARRKNGQLLRPLNAPALEEHRVLMRGTDADKYLSMAGRIGLYRTQKAFDDSEWERSITREMGVPFEVLDPSSMAMIEPHIKAVFYKGVRYSSSARLTNPGAVTATYALKFIHDGGHFLKADVQELSQSKDAWKITTSTGDVDTKEIVICAGPWAYDLLKPLGYHFPFGIKRGYHQHYTMTNGAAFSHAFTDLEVGYVMAPMEQGHRICTGAEFAGLGAPSDPAQLDMVLPFAKELFPIGEAVESDIWHGNRPCFPDSRPVIDSASRHPGLWFNIGHGHSGMTIGPSSARLLAEMMMGDKTFCDPTPYRAGRFNC